MPLIYQKVIKREDLRANPDILYVFGDNLAQKGLGGQAAEMRGEPNAVGIPTKNAPFMSVGAFFTDEDFKLFFKMARPRFVALQQHIDKGGIVVWPLDDIGTGRAQLKERAPRIWDYIQEWKETLKW